MLYLNKLLLPQLCAVLCLSPVLAQAQIVTPTPGTMRGTTREVNAAAKFGEATVSDKPALSDDGAMLDNDPRLKQAVTLRLDNVTLSRALAQLSATSHVSLIADGEQLQSKKVAATFVNKPLKDVLDAIAALGEYRWVGRKSGVFVLRAVPPKTADLQPSALDKWGKDIQHLFGKMTPEGRQALSKPYGTPLSALPPDMQSAMVGAISAMAAQDPIGPDGQPVLSYESALDNAGNLMVGVQAEPQGDGHYYYLSWSVPGQAGGTILVGQD